MPRAGTTWLYQNLKTHPEVSVTKFKETLHYLHSNDDEKLMAYFEDTSKKTLIDIDPIYYFDLDAIETISNKHTRVILIVRNEIDWKESIVAQSVRYGNTENLENLVFPFPRGNGQSIYFDMKSYNQEEHLAKVEGFFGRENLLILDFDEIGANPVSFLGKVERFIGISNIFTKDNVWIKKINSSSHKMPLPLRLIYRFGLARPIGYIARLFLPRRAYEYLVSKYFYGQSN